MCIITKVECDKIRTEHLLYLNRLSANARDMVYGETGGKLDIHQRRLGAEKLQPVVMALDKLLQNIGSYNFSCFEDVYEAVRKDVVSNGKWNNPMLLTYDISLRLAYRLDPVGLSLMPRKFLYLHAAPYRSARMIARKIKDKQSVVDGRVDASYLYKVFDCVLCDPAQKEHVLCLKHKLIEELYG